MPSVSTALKAPPNRDALDTFLIQRVSAGTVKAPALLAELVNFRGWHDIGQRKLQYRLDNLVVLRILRRNQINSRVVEYSITDRGRTALAATLNFYASLA